MKIEILFRAQRVDNGEWVEGYYIKSSKIHHLGESDIIVCGDSYNGYCGREFYDVIPETVCQFTGLTDKNGTKAFDKDLIKTPSGRIYAIIWATWIHDEKINKFITDRYEFTGWCISIDGVNPCDLLDSEVMSGEIIGNLIDSPELLK